MVQQAAIHFEPTTKAIDEGIAARVWYKGTDATATIEVEAAGNVVLVDVATGTTTFTTATANYDTLGELRNAINDVDGWYCQLVGGLSTDDAENTLGTLAATSAKFADAKSGVDLLIDTDVAEDSAGNLTNALGFSSASPFNQPYTQISEFVDNTDPVQNVYEIEGDVHEVSYCEVGYAGTTSSTATISFLSVNDRDDTTTTLYAAVTTTTGTTKTYQWTTLLGHPLTSKPGERLVIRLTAGNETTACSMTAHHRRVPRHTQVTPQTAG